MISQTLPRFWNLYYRPFNVKRTKLIGCDNPEAPGLYFKRVGKNRPVYSVRIGEGYRALGLLHGNTVTWFWIGAHDEYIRMLKQKGVFKGLGGHL